MEQFNPRLDILPAAQQRLWPALVEVPTDFVLYGGTALALHLGHRQSIDFDFFSHRSFDTMGLYHQLAFLGGAQIIQQAKDTLTCIVERDGPIRISFFGLPKIRALRPPLVTPQGIRVAALLDLAATKVAVVQQRAEAKDYLDLAALFQHGINLPVALAAGQAMYGAEFNPQLTLKALTFFGDGDLPTLPDETKYRLRTAARNCDPAQLPPIQPQHDGFPQ